MRVAWCTPFALRSAIGRFSALVIPELREHDGVEVDVFYPAGAGGRTQPDEGHELGPDAAEVLADYDLVVYNIGDHGGYHAPLADLCRHVPGLVVLHDISLIHMASSQMHGWSHADIHAEFRRWYGADGERAAEDMVRDAGHWAYQAANVMAFPMIERVLSPATGVVTHSAFAATRVRERFVGDTWCLPLPALHFDESEVDEVQLELLDGRPVILQAGVLNGNKCITTVIEGFRQSGLADRAQLVICGFAEPADLAALRRLVEDQDLRGSVTVLGQVTDATLHALRHRAVVATVLRDPSLEAASAVLLDSMAYGLAVITVDAGHYSEMPDDTVTRVPVPPRATDVAEALEQLLADPAAAVSMGVRAKDHVERHNTPKAYARGLVDVFERSGATARRRDLVVTLAHNLREVGFQGDGPVARVVARTAHELFGARPQVAPPD